MTDRILVVDDDEGLLHFLERFLSRKGYEAAVCQDGPTALARLRDERFDLLLIDYKMPGLNGLETLKAVRKLQVKTPVVIMTAFGTTETAIEAMKLGAYDYLLKPFNRDELARIIADALAVSHQMKELVSYPQARNCITPSASGGIKIIGNHKSMQEVYKLIGQVAEKDVNVLITGESGTGKELVARAIYHHSHLKDNPFLAVNCAAIPDPLYESELFGHERGAFTGAVRTHLGKFERGNGGTLFFDEIGDMSLSTQAKVLRVIQEGEFERVGGRESIKVKVRLLAATNKNLEREVDAGRFREDLYWRLKVIAVELPPLRQRLEDIPALVDYFVGRFSGDYHKPIRYVPEATLRKLANYPWPGNIRELENCIKRAVLLSAGDVLLEEFISLGDEKGNALNGGELAQLTRNLQVKLEALIPDILALARFETHANIMDLVEEALILKALEECGHNQVKAARLLGISRNTLRQRIKKYASQNSAENEEPNTDDF